MTFIRPTLSDLIERVRGDFETRLPGADSRLRHSVLDVQARAHAGVAGGLYAYLDWLARQIMPDTAEAEHLARWASIWGLRRKAATPARATATATGSDGAVIPPDTEALRVDGARYRVLDAATIGADVAPDTAILALEAVEPGPDGNLVAGTQLTLASAIGGVNAVITISAVEEAGTSEETDDSLLARLLARIRKVPQGGAAHDYVAWALAQPGVTRAWCWPGWMGIGTVGLGFVMDGRENILPEPADVAAVQTALDILRPVTAELHVFAPVAFPIDFVVAVEPNTPEVRAAIEAELFDAMTRDAAPGGIIHFSRMSEAISLAQGEFRHRLELPDRDVEAPPGAMPMLGEVSFVA